LLIFKPCFTHITTLYHTKKPMKLSHAHTMLFVGPVWENSKGGWFLFFVSLGLLGLRKCDETLDPSPSLIFIGGACVLILLASTLVH
jgi:hypothetical protein